jgi:hypothetical protein
MLTPKQEALRHSWLSGENATDHNLLPEIKAYMAKARLRRGIELVKLANRIEALKMQEDESDETSGDADVPANAKAAAGNALATDPTQEKSNKPGLATDASAGSTSGGKKSLSKLAKSAIFREANSQLPITHSGANFIIGCSCQSPRDEGKREAVSSGKGGTGQCYEEKKLSRIEVDSLSFV